MSHRTYALHSFVKGTTKRHIRCHGTGMVGGLILSNELVYLLSLFTIAGSSPDFVAQGEKFVNDVCCKIPCRPVTRTQESLGMTRSRDGLSLAIIWLSASKDWNRLQWLSMALSVYWP